MFPVALTVSFPARQRAEFVARVRSWSTRPDVDHVFVAEDQASVRSVLFIHGNSPSRALELAREMAASAMSDLHGLGDAVIGVQLLADTRPERPSSPEAR